MAFPVLMVQVLVAAPGDTEGARRVVRQALEDWNALNGEATGVAFQPIMWERDGVPEPADLARADLDRHLVEKADVIVGTFWTRLGTADGDRPSTTAEQILCAIAAGTPALVYFATQPVLPDAVDEDEYARLRAFRERLQDRALADTYDTEAELARKLAKHLTTLARESFCPKAPGPVVPGTVVASPVSLPHAVLSGSIQAEREVAGVDEGGSPRYRTRHRFVVVNEGEAAAENVRLQFLPQHPGEEAPEPVGPSPVVRLAPRGALGWPIAGVLSDAPRWDVLILWSEGGTEYEERLTVRL